MLARAYVALFLDVTGKTLDFPGAQFIVQPMSGWSCFWSWLQAQIAAQGLFEIYYQIARITAADHERASKDR